MKVLVCGHRGGLAKALGDFGVPFCVWHDRPVIAPGTAGAVLEAPFAEKLATVKTTLERFPAAHGATHVLAGTERAVVNASLARRVLDARRGPHSVSLRCHDKLFMKRALTVLGVPMTEYVDGNRVDSLPALIERLGSPVVLKQRRESGGRGQDLVFQPADRPVRLRGKLAERFVDAPEVSVESFVSSRRVLFENVTEYLRKKHINVVPAELAPAQRDRLLAINRQTLGGLRIRWGMSHLECFVTPEGPIFSELALRPPGGYIMELISLAYGFNAWKAFVAVELDQSWAFPTAPRAHAAAIILHPGPGRVRRVTGLSKVRRHPAVTHARVKVRAGGVVAPRTGAGQDVGYVLLRERDRPRLLDAIEEVERLLVIDTE